MSLSSLSFFHDFSLRLSNLLIIWFLCVFFPKHSLSDIVLSAMLRFSIFQRLHFTLIKIPQSRNLFFAKFNWKRRFEIWKGLKVVAKAKFEITRLTFYVLHELRYVFLYFSCSGPLFSLLRWKMLKYQQFKFSNVFHSILEHSIDLNH